MSYHYMFVAVVHPMQIDSIQFDHQKQVAKGRQAAVGKAYSQSQRPRAWPILVRVKDNSLSSSTLIPTPLIGDWLAGGAGTALALPLPLPLPFFAGGDVVK